MKLSNYSGEIKEPEAKKNNRILTQNISLLTNNLYLCHHKQNLSQCPNGKKSKS